LKRLFRELFFRKGFSYDNMFDWELIAMQMEGQRDGLGGLDTGVGGGGGDDEEVRDRDGEKDKVRRDGGAVTADAGDDFDDRGGTRGSSRVNTTGGGARIGNGGGGGDW
jgi:hypothetical protein